MTREFAITARASSAKGLTRCECERMRDHELSMGAGSKLAEREARANAEPGQ